MTELKRLDIALRGAFTKLGITKKGDMAIYLGYKFPYFSGVTNGKETLSDIFLDKISDKLNISSAWIKDGEGQMLKSEIDKAVVNERDYISNTESVPASELMKALANISEAANNISEAAKINAIANERNSRNVETMLAMIKDKDKQSEENRASNIVEKGGLKSSGNSDDNSATDADRADVG